MIVTQKVSVTTSTGGASTDYTPAAINGAIYAVEYDKDDFANGVDFTITGETSGVGVWTESDVNAADICRPTILVQDQTNTDTTQRDFVRLFNERLKIVIASGGSETSGSFLVRHEGR